MLENFDSLVPVILAIAAAAYALLAARLARITVHNPNNLISFFMLLFAGMCAGSAFSYGATDAHLYGIGRVLAFSAAGFVPVVFYCIYREYTVGPPNALILLVLSIIPTMTVGLAWPWPCGPPDAACLGR